MSIRTYVITVWHHHIWYPIGMSFVDAFLSLAWRRAILLGCEVWGTRSQRAVDPLKKCGLSGQWYLWNMCHNGLVPEWPTRQVLVALDPNQQGPGDLRLEATWGYSSPTQWLYNHSQRGCIWTRWGCNPKSYTVKVMQVSSTILYIYIYIYMYMYIHKCI